jgi:hypothetical protein
MQARTIDLVSMYLSQPVLRAHDISLQLTEARLGTMKGMIRLDPNRCSVDLWGDRGGCTKMAPQTYPVEAVAMRTRDPQGHHRTYWKLDLDGLSGTRASLIEYSAANLWYLSIITEDEGSSVVPLFDAKLFAGDAASPDPGRVLREVTEYHLRGEGAEIVFHKGKDDDMKLEYNHKVFSGRALSREVTTLGLAVSVILEASPDLGTVWLTVIIPDANCPDGARSIPINSFAVVTDKRTSIAGPPGVSGQVDVYKSVLPLTGNAW